MEIVDHHGERVRHGRATVNGVRLHYLTAGEGEPVLLLHGVPKTSYHWRHVIPLLTPHYQVVVPDMRGLGDSEHADGGYDMANVAEDFAELMTELGHDRFRVVVPGDAHQRARAGVLLLLHEARDARPVGDHTGRSRRVRALLLLARRRAVHVRDLPGHAHRRRPEQGVREDPAPDAGAGRGQRALHRRRQRAADARGRRRRACGDPAVGPSARRGVARRAGRALPALLRRGDGMTYAVRDGRLVGPDGNPFLSLGLNHTDEAALKFPRAVDVWRERYGSRQRWIRDGVVADLRGWGFNTLGWTREYVAGGWGEALDWFGDPIDLKHSTPWSAAELRGAGIPYVAQVPVQEIEDWNGHPAFRPLDDDFVDWCDHLGRAIAAEHADSPDLLGYFLVDIPAWLPHASGRDFAELAGLEPGARERALYDVASRYYETIATAIRRYDPDHLILGDRFNGNKGIPEPVLRAMAPHVDVLSVQYFTEPTDASRRGMRDGPGPLACPVRGQAGDRRRRRQLDAHRAQPAPRGAA
ncbi:hypothetical protein L7F22_028574 [Adiantum nelumboides]|nr:hypothetical protein [Adiantum nelumboides]